MVIICISGSGIGAGKTTLAKKLSNPVWSLAGALRQELATLLPNYDWFNKSQDYKDKVKVKERGNKTIRQVLIEHGQVRCNESNDYWVERLCDKLGTHNEFAGATMAIAVDDIRKVSEIDFIRNRFGKYHTVLHYHVKSDQAIPEAEFENDKLEIMADYILIWNKK